MKLNASQAAKATGKSIPTITRAIKSGKISGEPDGKGYLIEAAELFRVFPATKDDTNNVSNKNANNLGHETNKNNHDSAILRREIDMLHEMLEREKDTVRDLRTRLDSESEERRRLTAMLTDQRKPEPAPKLPWWRRPIVGS